MSIQHLNKRERVYQHPTINADSFDKRQFNSLLSKSKGLKNLKERGDEAFPLFSQLMGDLWSSFYKSGPKLLEDIPEHLTANRSYMETVMKDEGFEDFRQHTRFDEVSSALSTISFGDKVLAWISEQKDADDHFNEAVRQALDDQKQFVQLQESEDNPNEQEPSRQKLQQSLSAVNRELQTKLRDDGHQFQKMLKQSVEESITTQRKMEKLYCGNGQGSGRKELERLSVKEKFQLADLLQNLPFMRKIAEWAGRFQEIAKSKQKQMHRHSVERSGITFSSEVDRLLPAELSHLAIPQAKLDFLRRLAQGQAMTYDSRGKDRLGKGQIILCMDQSHSMREMEAQSKGFVLAMMNLAKRQGRDFALITFAKQAETKIFQKGKMSVGDLCQLVEEFVGGGTNFHNPLEQSLALIKQSRFKMADIVFVTDGQANLSSSFIEGFNVTKEKKKFQCLGVLIGPHANRETVQQFSDKIIAATDLTQAEEAFVL